MMKGSKLAAELKKALKDLNPAKQASKIASEYQRVIKEYLEKNMEISFAYAGNNVETGAPDIEPDFPGEISFSSFVFLPAATKELFDLQLGTALKTGIVTVDSKKSNGVEIIPTTLNPAGIMLVTFPKFDPSAKDASVDKFMEDYCDSIIDKIKTSFLNPIKTAGSRESASSAGMVTMTGIK